jgi:hypothetical protein
MSKESHHLKRVSHSGKIDFTDHEFSVDERLDKLIAAACEKLIQSLMDEDSEYPAYAFLPWEWSDSDGLGGARPDDPLTIYVRLPFDSGWEMPTWSFSLNGCIDDAIEMWTDDDNKNVVIGEPACLVAIRDALRTAAQRIDDALTIAKDKDSQVTT